MFCSLLYLQPPEILPCTLLEFKKSLQFYLDILFNVSMKQKYIIESIKLKSIPSAQHKAVQVCTAHLPWVPLSETLRYGGSDRRQAEMAA